MVCRDRRYEEMLRRIYAVERLKPRADFDFYMKQSPCYRRLISIIYELCDITISKNIL